MYLCWAKCLYEVEIGGEKSEFTFPRTILKFLRCFCAQDVAGKIRDTAFKILMEHFWRALKLSTLQYRDKENIFYFPNYRGVFRTQSDNGFQPLTVFEEKAPSQIFDWVLNMPLYYLLICLKSVFALFLPDLYSSSLLFLIFPRSTTHCLLHYDKF